MQAAERDVVWSDIGVLGIMRCVKVQMLVTSNVPRVQSCRPGARVSCNKSQPPLTPSETTTALRIGTISTASHRNAVTTYRVQSTEYLQRNKN